MKIKNKTIKNKVKPVSFMLDFEYRCPACGLSHFATYNECRANDFFIVCDCATKFRVKTIKEIKIQYKKPSIKKKKSKSIPVEQTSSTVIKTKTYTCPDYAIQECISTLSPLGFTENEVRDQINNIYNEHPEYDIPNLIKTFMKTLEIQQDEQ